MPEEVVPLVTKYRKDKAELRALRGTTEKDPITATGKPEDEAPEIVEEVEEEAKEE